MIGLSPFKPAEDVEDVVLGEVVLKVDDLKKYYSVSGSAFGGGEGKTVKANETLSFEARESETLAIVGESGCGKSTLAKVLMGLETASDGSVVLNGVDVEDVAIEDRTVETVSQVQMVFQNPFDTLNPSMSVGNQIIRALEIFRDRQLRRRPRKADAGAVGSGQAAAVLSPPVCRASCLVGRNNVWASPVRLQATRRSLWRMNRSQPSTCQCRRRSQIC